MADPSFYIGLMSGTSLDGVDSVLVDLSSNNQPILLKSYSHQIPSSLRTKIKEFTQSSWRGSVSDIGAFNQQLGMLFADAVNALLLNSNVGPNDIHAIGSHGQTIWHQPHGKFPFSLQFGDANIITEMTGITTVGDFRNRDIAAGGQGAPLVPAFHHHVLTHPYKHRTILNIGGIANITVLPSKASHKETIGFDTGPGNGLIDAWNYTCNNSSFDDNGDWGRSGAVQNKLLNILLNETYFSLPAPKSTGKELFNLSWLHEKLGLGTSNHKPEDIQATLTELTSKSIANNIPTSCDELFICGGGIHNKYLIERLQNHLPNLPIASTQTLGIDPDWMEAIAFSWLAKQTIEGNAGNLPSTTGAKGSRILGAIYSA